MEKIIIIGAGGFGLEILDLIDQINQNEFKYHILGFLDDCKDGNLVPGISIIGTTKEIDTFYDSLFVIGIANPKIREHFYNLLKSKKFLIPNLIHPTALVSNYAQINGFDGIIVNSYSIIAPRAEIGKGTIIDSYVYVGHESKLEEFVTVYSGALIAGNVIIGKSSQIGLGARIIQGKIIGSNSIIGAGSTVVKDILSNVIAVGTPCLPIKENN